MCRCICDQYVYGDEYGRPQITKDDPSGEEEESEWRGGCCGVLCGERREGMGKGYGDRPCAFKFGEKRRRQKSHFVYAAAWKDGWGGDAMHRRAFHAGENNIRTHEKIC